ncbi:MAG: type III pantothenate kinase [Caldilineales bacterium]|nr:type III pantothenate kinase [Caldilineales bacterium]
MLLLIDIGNTNIVFGLSYNQALVRSWRLQTQPQRSADEYRAILTTLSQADGIELSKQVRAVAIASVVPQVTDIVQRLCGDWLNQTPLVISASLDFGMKLLVREPYRVGVDRLLNAVAVKAGWGAPSIAIDFGTATKFDVVNADGDFQGGAIAPGLAVAADSLVSKAAMLPNIPFVPPAHPVGDDTISAMQSGIVLGYLSLVEGLLARIKQTLPQENVPVIATGGLAGLIMPLTTVIDFHEPDLTLLGLQIVWQRNRS